MGVRCMASVHLLKTHAFFWFSSCVFLSCSGSLRRSSLVSTFCYFLYRSQARCLKFMQLLCSRTPVSSFDKVEHQRKSLAVKLGGKLLERASLIPEQIMGGIIEKAQSAMSEGAVDCESISLRLAFTILGSTIFGDVFLPWPKAIVYEELLMNISKDACFWASYVVAPFWKQKFWRYQDSCTKLKGLTQELIRECGQNCKSGFLWDFGDRDEIGYEPCGEIISLMFHGSLTMAALIANILTRLVTHLNIQDKIYSEVVMAQKVMGQADEQNFDLMPNLLATVYESARLLPAGPILQRCSLRHGNYFSCLVIICNGEMKHMAFDSILDLLELYTCNCGTHAYSNREESFICSFVSCNFVFGCVVIILSMAL